MNSALDNWSNLNTFLREATEEQCNELLKTEFESKARFSVMNRIYGRMSALRSQRERNELLAKAKEK